MATLLTLTMVITAPACGGGQPSHLAPGVVLLGHIAHPAVTECSGVAASRRHPGTFWVHNDGGGKKREVLYAIDRTGRSLATFQVVGAKFHDWEDIAIDGEGHLYLGDLGNNDLRRGTLAVHLVDEPDPSRGDGQVAIVRSWVLQFPAQPFDCESLFVHQGTGYVIAKLRSGAMAGLYSFSLAPTDQPVVLARAGHLPIVVPVTGAALSPDGRLLAIVTHSSAAVYRCDGDLGQLRSIRPHSVLVPGRPIEGCCFTPEGLLATTESREIFLFTDAPFRDWK